MDDSSWMDEAACKEGHPEAFFPPGNSIPMRGSRLSEPKEFCARCPVQQICLEYAIAHGINHGVWGGMSKEERKRERKRRSRLARKLKLEEGM